MGVKALKNKFKKTSFVGVALAAALCLTGCSASLASTKAEKEIVMTVGEYDVPYEVYRYFAMNYKNAAGYDEDKIDSEVREAIKSLYAMFALAEERGIETDDRYIEALVNDAAESAVNEHGGKKEYKSAIAESYMNDSVFRLLSKNEIVREELYRNMISGGEISDDKDVMRGIIDSDEFICVKQILILGENSTKLSEGTYTTPAAKHTDEEAAALAKEARERAANGEDFDSLVAEYGESLYMFSNTEGYYICRGMWDSVNEDAAFALEVGGVSPVVVSSAGYSVFKRCEKNSDYIDKNFNSICNNYYGAYLTLKLEEKAESMEITETDAYSKISLSDMK